MKRFRSPLDQLSRVKAQTERMAELQVTHARNEAATAEAMLISTQSTVARHLAEMAARLTAPSTPWALIHAGETLQEYQLQVNTVREECTRCQSNLAAALSLYQATRQQREMVETVIDKQRHRHRRECLAAGQIEVLDRSLRQTADANRTSMEDASHA